MEPPITQEAQVRAALKTKKEVSNTGNIWELREPRKDAGRDQRNHLNSLNSCESTGDFRSQGTFKKAGHAIETGLSHKLVHERGKWEIIV